MSLTQSELQQKLALPELTAHPHRFGESVYSLVVPGKSAVIEWERLRKTSPPLGYWPVIFGEPKNLQRIAPLLSSPDAEDIPASLEQAARLNVEDYLRKRTEEQGDGTHGDWPGRIQGNESFTLPRPILSPSEFHARVDIGLVPAKEVWDVPAKLSIGGWNECPYPHEHVAVHHYWNQKYGAEMVGYSGDVIEMQVARKPASREEALKLANEQYAYCLDIVEQGVGTIEHLAATLLESNIWFFWWD